MLHVPKHTIPQIISLNGQIIGDTTQEIVCPISPSGTIYLTAQPMEQGYMPHAMKLQLMQGQPIEPPIGGECFLQGQSIHVQWNLQQMKKERLTKYPHALANQTFFCNGQAYEATLYEEQETYLAIEEQESQNAIFLYQVEDMTYASIQVVSVFSEADLLIQGKGEIEDRFLFCAKKEDRFIVLLDEYGSAHMDNKDLIVFQPLQDALGHQRRTVYQFEEDHWSLQSEQIVDLSLENMPLLPLETMARAFAQAVLYQKEEEMRWCLEPEWAKELTLQDATEFLGNFDFVYEAEKIKEEQIVLLLAAKLFENAYVLREFRCTFTQGRISNLETD